MLRDVQYNKQKLNYGFSLMISMAFIAQLIFIYLKLGTNDYGILDYYLLNVQGMETLETIVGWVIPILIGVITFKQFSYFNDIKYAIFVRTNQTKFIKKRAIISFVIGYINSMVFYLSCLLFLFIIMYFINPNLSLGPSIPISFMISQKVYFTYPFLYLFFYINLISMYCGAFAVAGFIVSLYVDNKVWLMLSPLAYVFGSMILFEGIPYGQLVSYNSYVSLYLPQYIHAPSEIMTACICMLSIILLIAMEFLFIHYKGRRDL